MRFSWSTHLLFVFGHYNICQKDWLTYTGGTDRPGELISQMTFLRWLTFLLGSLTVKPTILFFWIYLFLLTLVFVLQWPFLKWEILVMLSQFPLTFYQTQNERPCFMAQLMTIFVIIGTVFVIIWEMFHGRISLNLVLLLLLVNFVSGSRLELIYMSLIVSIRSNLTHLHGFLLLVHVLC